METCQCGEECHTSGNCWSPTRVVKEWLPPQCKAELVPKVGLTFDNLEQCEKFYKTYAHLAGFSVRKASSKKDKQGHDKYKYFVCSKEGYREDNVSASSKAKEKVRTRKVKVTRVGCKALVGFRRTANGRYVVHKFYESHTHLLGFPKKCGKPKWKHRKKSVHMSSAYSDTGPSGADHLMEEQLDDLENAESARQAFWDSEGDLSACMNGCNSFMFIENLKKKKVVDDGFYFAYELDEHKRLKHVFWADAISKRNYTLFGDAVSFDTMLGTNRYKMIFASFTGLDNHRLCATFGGALLAGETTASFVWLFERFLEAMGSRKPVSIITDHHAAVKLAVERVFDTSTHRYYMWNIMRRLSEEVGPSLNSDVDFNTQIRACVYNSQTPAEFETTWLSIMEIFGLAENDWLTEMYSIRDMWIPAYFRDLFLGATLRTTSRSKSETCFFRNFTNPRLSLVEFWTQFESAVALQRHYQSKADIDTFLMPQLKTNRDLEKHAAQVYTHSNFYRFQSELWVAYTDCAIDDKEEINEGLLVTMEDTSKKDVMMVVQIIYNPLNNVAHCSCKMFECEGIPCRHILCILKGKLRELPSYYILNRWTKTPTCKPIFSGDICGLKSSQMNQVEKLISDCWTTFITCMEIAGRDQEKLTLVSGRISNVKKQLVELKGSASESRVEDLEPCTGSSAIEHVDFLPEQSNIESSAKRIEEGKEPAVEQEKRMRVCRACLEESYHDSRNCPSKENEEVLHKY